MILSPALTRNWTQRLRWIILDEIHTIGQQEGGAVWEQLLLFAPCPIIGLSATIGNAREFNAWVASVQEQHGLKHNLVVHANRYSHLRKFFFSSSSNPPAFKGLDSPAPVDLEFIHPMSVLQLGPRALPEDLALESRDCLSLWHAMTAAAANNADLLASIHSLEPKIFFQRNKNDFITQGNVLQYEAALKHRLRSWGSEASGGQDVRVIAEKLSGTLAPSKTGDTEGAILPNIVHLLSELNQRNDLPGWS